MNTNDNPECVNYYNRLDQATLPKPSHHERVDSEAKPGLMQQDAEQSTSRRRLVLGKYHRRTVMELAVIIVVVLVIGLMVLCTKWYRDTYHRWNPPFMWNTCTQVLRDTFAADDQGLLESMDTPCSSSISTAETALCTYSQNRLYMYCRGRYYQTSKRVRAYDANNDDDDANDVIYDDYYETSSPYLWKFEEYGSTGVLGAVWEDSRDCDELELTGWELICLENDDDDDDDVARNQDNQDANDKQVVCARNSSNGYVFCRSQEYRYYGSGCFKNADSGSPGNWVIVDTSTNSAAYHENSKSAARQCRFNA